MTKRFFGNGVQLAGGNLYYQEDHLGSIRGLADPVGNSIANYDFDLWGRRNRVSGESDADFGFTGHLESGATNLTLATYRGYDGDMGRWVSRDPLGESKEFNLYRYGLANPSRYLDRLGLDVSNTEMGVGFATFGGWCTAMSLGWMSMAEAGWLGTMSMDLYYLGVGGATGGIGLVALGLLMALPDLLKDEPVPYRWYTPMTCEQTCQ